ncbi:MAG TPA: hypothetical protein VK568_10270 [Thermodesulfobacteriota bacterium]|jgi:hypothetical protein|nr:hypothetical protein [Thermodesulfobacteriota bacterium]
MLREDFVIQANIRRMLTRTDIDASQIDFGTVRGVVYIQGTFQLSRFDPSWDSDKANEFAVNTLYSLEKKIRRISGVSDVIFQLNNWEKEKGHWFHAKMTKEDETK